MIQLDDLRVYLTKRRKLLGLTQDAVALRMGVNQSVVARLENGGAKDPTIRSVTRWASALGLAFSMHFTEPPK